ncbi:hypothetical protein NHQ30_005865 [Ciborinia camelliae]|nr:hypothetical protein NHQ30_005865 [Ciborinia camelliae]
MAPFRKKEVGHGPVVWKSSHIDEILVAELLALHERDLKVWKSSHIDEILVAELLALHERDLKVWKSSHIDDILVEKILQLQGRDLEEETMISVARSDRKYSHLDDKDIFAAYVVGEWIQDVVFRKDGRRCIIKKDVDLHSGKGRLFKFFRLEKDICHRHYYIDPRHRTLAQIDRTSKKKIALRKSFPIYNHMSEGSWALPPSDKHHFLKFPTGAYCPTNALGMKLTFCVEIIDQILGYLVRVPDVAVAPSVVTCNWKRVWMGAPTFTIRQQAEPNDPDGISYGSGCHIVRKDYDTVKPLVLPSLAEDEDGSLRVYRRVSQEVLAASVLRVCKRFNSIGGNLLYGLNYYTFEMTNGSFEGSPRTWIGKEVWRPSPKKPYFHGGERSAEVFHTRIRRGIMDIERHVYIKRLVGWVYYDPFLRFLYAIGPRNAALLRTLEFSGEACCVRHISGLPCGNCILASLPVYIPFINRFCPNVRRLVLSMHGSSSTDEEVEMIFYQKVPNFFENDLRNLQYITELAVVDVSSESHRMRNKICSLAGPAINFFRDRAAERAKDGRVADS